MPRRCLGLFALAIVAPLWASPESRGDFVTGGTLTLNLDGAAFADGVDVATMDAVLGQHYGTSYNRSQTFLEFGRHVSSSEIVGLPVNALRPGSAANFDDIRSGWARPSSHGLAFDVNGATAAAGSASTFTYDPSNVEGTAGGVIGTSGAVSFWYANDSLIATGSVWSAFGNFTLRYSAARETGLNSGWHLVNTLLGNVVIFDVQKADVTTSAGLLAISGDLNFSQEYSDFLFGGQIAGLKAGTFSLNATAVPEPSSFVMLGIAGAASTGAAAYRRRGRRERSRA